MAQSDLLTLEEELRETRLIARQLISAINAAYEKYNDFQEFDGGRVLQIVTQDLFELAKVREATLSIVSGTGVVTCLTGYNLFSVLSVGDQIAMSDWTNAGNNVNRYISAKADNDTITLDDLTGLVTETDKAGVNFRVRAKTWQTDIVQDIIDANDAFKIPWDAMNNVAVTTAARMDTLRRVT